MWYAVGRGPEIFVGTIGGVPEGENSAGGGFPDDVRADPAVCSW